MNDGWTRKMKPDMETKKNVSPHRLEQASMFFTSFSHSLISTDYRVTFDFEKSNNALRTDLNLQSLKLMVSLFTRIILPMVRILRDSVLLILTKDIRRSGATLNEVKLESLDCSDSSANALGVWRLME